MKYSFVILHYNVIEETIICVDSIKKRIKKPVDIIIVDNASPNGSGNELYALYKDDKQVVVLLNKKNVGFAQGNNVGIDYARKALNSDFVIVLNNDTYLTQDDFLETIESEWIYSRFAVMGPKVHTYSNINQNPMPCKLTTFKQVNRLIRYNYLALIRIHLGIDEIYNGLKKIIKHVIKFKRPELEDRASKDNLRQEDVKLHGCCYVFSPAFFEHFNGFDSRTFMYLEEDILYNQVKNKKLIMVYNPKLEIFHAEMAATKKSTKNKKKMNVFRCRESIKSLKILRKVLEEGT